MKFRDTLTEKDKTEIKKTLDGICLQVYDKVKRAAFSVGDILIKRHIYFPDSDNPKEMQIQVREYDNSSLPIRYLVTHVEEATGIAFAKTVMENGKLDKEIFCIQSEMMQEFYGDEYSFYEVDPLFIDAVMLEHEFDINLLLKEEQARKKNIMDKNKSAAIHFSNLKAVNKFLMTLPIGSTLYYHGNDKATWNSNECSEVVIKKKPRRMSRTKYLNTSRGMRFNNRGTINKLDLESDTVVLYISNNHSPVVSAELINMALYTGKPISIKDQAL